MWQEMRRIMPSGKLWDRAREGLLDLVFPRRCAGCGKEGAWLCHACRGSLKPLSPPLCWRCGLPLPGGGLCLACQGHPGFLEGLRSAFYLEGPLRDAVHQFKYRNIRALAPTLGELLWGAWPGLSGGVTVVPVPLHPRRLRHRGYNQAALLAREVAQRAGVSVTEGALARLRDTPSQAQGMGIAERRRNVQGAFACRAPGLAGQTVVLVDDVCTTGATLQACARALHDAGAGPVWGLTLARER